MSRPDISGKKVGPYLLTSIVGAGTLGDVYRAVDTSSESLDVYGIKCVPTKHLSNEQIVQIVKELYHHRSVSHCEYILQLRDFVEKKSYVYIVFDLCETDVSRVIQKTRLYWKNEPLIKTAFLEILDGVQACHQRGIAHRDLTPENIMCNANGTGIQIRSFGQASSRRARGNGGRRSPLCVSPEYWTYNEEDPDSGAMSDIWSLGIILFNMVTGYYPWKSVFSDEDYMSYVRNTEYLRDTYEISESLNYLLRRMLHPDPEKRFKIPRIRKEIIAMNTFYRWEGGDDTTSTKEPVPPEWDELDIYFAEAESTQHTFMPSFKKLVSWGKCHPKSTGAPS